MTHASTHEIGATAQTAAIGLAVTDHENRIRSANEFFCRMLGRSEGELAGTSLERWLSSDGRPDEGAPPAAIPSECRLRADHDKLIRVRLTRFPMQAAADAGAGALWVAEPLPEDQEDTRKVPQLLDISEDKFRWMLESSPIGVVQVYLGGQVIRANDACLRLLGITREEFMRDGLNLRDVTPPEWLETTDGNVSASFKTRGSIAYRKEYLTRSGARVPVQIVLCWSETVPDEALAFIIDLSEQQRTQHEMHVMEKRLRAALKAAETDVWERDVNTGALIWTDELRQFYGLAPGTEVSPEKWESFIVPEHREAVLEAVHGALRGGRYDTRFRVVVSGTPMWLRSKGMCELDEQGLPVRFSGVSMDITAQMLTEEELEAVNRRYRSHLENSPLAAIEFNSSFEVTNWAGAAEQMFGWSADEIVGKRLGEWQFVHEDDEAAAGEIVLNLLRNHPDGSFSANRNYTKDGRVLHCEWHNSVLLDEDGRVESILSLGLDVTEQTLTHRALIDSEERYRTLVESIPGIVFITDPEGFNIFVNTQYEQFTGLTAQELLHDGWVQALHPDDRERGRQAWMEAVNQRQPYQMEYRFRRFDGVYLWFLARGVPQFDSEGGIQSWIGICTEIEKQKQIKARLETLVLDRTKALGDTVEKLEAALAEKTVLLKEVHHRVKNNLAVIASLLSRQAESVDNPVAARNLEDSRRRVQAMALVHEHLYSTDQFDRVNFADYIRDFVGELSAAMVSDSKRVRLVIEAEPIDLGVHRAIPCALIVNELTTNALKYAFPGDRRGEVRVSFGGLPGDRVALIVTDNGVGLPEGDQWRSSKSLGLKIVRLLVKQLDGVLELIPGPGTTFRIEFPASGQ